MNRNSLTYWLLTAERMNVSQLTRSFGESYYIFRDFIKPQSVRLDVTDANSGIRVTVADLLEAEYGRLLKGEHISSVYFEEFVLGIDFLFHPSFELILKGGRTLKVLGNLPSLMKRIASHKEPANVPKRPTLGINVNKAKKEKAIVKAKLQIRGTAK